VNFERLFRLLRPFSRSAVKTNTLCGRKSEEKVSRAREKRETKKNFNGANLAVVEDDKSFVEFSESLSGKSS
jgi:hypothetical protein